MNLDKIKEEAREEGKEKVFNKLAFIGRRGEDYLEQIVYPFIDKYIDKAAQATRERDIEVVEITAIDLLDGARDEPHLSKMRRQLAQALRNL